MEHSKDFKLLHSSYSLYILYYVSYRGIVVRRHWASLNGALQMPLIDWFIDWLTDWLTDSLHQLSYSWLHQHQQTALCAELSCQAGTEWQLTPFSLHSYYSKYAGSLFSPEYPSRQLVSPTKYFPRSAYLHVSFAPTLYTSPNFMLSQGTPPWATSGFKWIWQTIL